MDTVALVPINAVAVIRVRKQNQKNEDGIISEDEHDF